MQGQSKIPSENRFIGKDEALKAVEIIYNFISYFKQIREERRKSPEALENSPRGITVGKKTLKEMADQERNVRKFLAMCLKELERFAKEINEKY